MQRGMQQQALAVAYGYWPLFRYDPVMRSIGENPFRLESARPTIPFRNYAYNEIRYRALAQTRPEEAAELLGMAQDVVHEKYRTYEEMAGCVLRRASKCRRCREGGGVWTSQRTHTQKSLGRLSLTIDVRPRKSSAARGLRRCRGCLAFDFRGADRSRGGLNRAAHDLQRRQFPGGALLLSGRRQ
jgi:hypothetical protein